MRRRYALVLLWAAAAPSAFAEDQPSPYLIDEKAFADRVHRVAVAPVDVPPWMAMPAELRAEVDALIQERLEKADFEIIPNSEYAAIQSRMVEYTGGLNGADGKVDAARLQVVRDHSFREMLLRHPFDALVIPRVVRVDVPWSDDRAEWDGAKQTIESKGGGSYSGSIAAATLEIRFVDRSEQPLYIGNGGIEVLQQREKERLIPVPAEELWQKEKRVTEAVDIALDEL